VNLPEETAVIVNPATGVYDTPTPVSGTLIDTYTNQPVPNEPLILTVNGTQSCTATTNAQGVATCDITPTEPKGTYPLTGAFSGDNSSQPQLLPSNGASTFTVTPAPTTVIYTGPTILTNGQPAALSGVLTASVPAPGTPLGGQPVTISIGSGTSAQNCSGTTNGNGVVNCTVAKVNQSSGTVTITTSYAGNQYYQPSSANTPAIVQTPTTLTVSAATGVYGSPTTVTGTLTSSVTGLPIGGQTVTLTLNGTQSCTATTNASGVASCSITPNEPAGSYPLTGTFAGNPSTANGPRLLPSTGANTFVVTKASTSVTDTSPTIVVSGWPVTLTGTVTTSGGSGPGGLPVTLTLGSGSTSQSCTGIASPTGVVSCTITDVNQVPGSVPLTVTFPGNGYYQSSSTSTTETTAGFPNGGGTTSGTVNPSPAGGGFVVGDVSAGAPTNGTTVNFWGSQLWKKNVFTGVNNSPASMKGYIDNAANYVCGAQWTSNPGNSSNPPSTVPVNMVVVVASAIYQNGSIEYGNIKHLVVVRVAPGYGPAPGHDGYGQIIATLC
jgi:hypothetical protein